MIKKEITRQEILHLMRLVSKLLEEENKVIKSGLEEELSSIIDGNLTEDYCIESCNECGHYFFKEDLITESFHDEDDLLDEQGTCYTCYTGLENQMILDNKQKDTNS